MFSLDAHTRVYIAADPLDFRKQIDGVALAVQETLATRSIFIASVFVFRNRQKDKLKLLYWHHNGYVLLYKRLEKGRFVWPAHDATSPLCINLRELHALLEGSDISQLPHIKRLDYQRV